MLFVSKSLLLTLALFVGQALSSPTPDSGPSATITAAPSAPTGCDTGSTALCCQKFSTASDPVVGLLLQLLGIVVTDTRVTVGVTCTDIDNARGGVNICTQNSLCCTQNDFGGILALGCSTVDIPAASPPPVVISSA